MGCKSRGYVTVGPFQTVSLGGIGFGQYREPGRYIIQARYYNYEGTLVKSSNKVELHVKKNG
jgi:hypothetical protein